MPSGLYLGSDYSDDIDTHFRWNLNLIADDRMIVTGMINPTQGTDVWCVYAFILCLCCPVFR
jgi:hypothetical protein